MLLVGGGAMDSTNRRSFLSHSVATAVALGASSRACAASEVVGVAVIGVNGMGHFHTRALAGRQDVRLVALCDPDPNVLARAAKTAHDASGKKPELVADFRKLLDNKAVEAVV